VKRGGHSPRLAAQPEKINNNNNNNNNYYYYLFIYLLTAIGLKPHHVKKLKFGNIYQL
jgi:hypothetical protein